jgi:hypothetical protein
MVSRGLGRLRFVEDAMFEELRDDGPLDLAL